MSLEPSAGTSSATGATAAPTPIVSPGLLLIRIAKPSFDRSKARLPAPNAALNSAKPNPALQSTQEAFGCTPHRPLRGHFPLKGGRSDRVDPAPPEQRCVPAGPSHAARFQIVHCLSTNNDYVERSGGGLRGASGAESPWADRHLSGAVPGRGCGPGHTAPTCSHGSQRCFIGTDGCCGPARTFSTWPLSE